MDRLWTPWRYDYITHAKGNAVPGVPASLQAWAESGAEPSDCVFCNKVAAVEYAVAQGMPVEDAEQAARIVVRGTDCFICLNEFPYSTGHVLILPYRHIDSLAGLESGEAQEMMQFAQRTELALRTVYKPAGMNFGLNLGEAGGAGIASHIHMHGLPRWIGDANFMTVTAETRVLPETLEVTCDRLRRAWHELFSPVHR